MLRSFEELLDCVEDNNRINDAQWSDWQSTNDILEIYGGLSHEKKHVRIVALVFLADLIRRNGEGKEYYIDAIQMLDSGKVYSR